MHLQAPPPRPPLALRCIALFEAAKGLLALAATCGIISLRHTDLLAATDTFLLRHEVDPERHYTRLFIEWVAKATNHHTGEIAAVGFAYVLIRCVEGYGLWQGKHWAEWLAVISAGLYLPLEMQHFAHNANIPKPVIASPHKALDGSILFRDGEHAGVVNRRFCRPQDFPGFR
jgi:uncharacterized membrane protein (DUF2068 family)